MALFYIWIKHNLSYLLADAVLFVCINKISAQIIPSYKNNLDSISVKEGVSCKKSILDIFIHQSVIEKIKTCDTVGWLERNMLWQEKQIEALLDLLSFAIVSRLSIKSYSQSNNVNLAERFLITAVFGSATVYLFDSRRAFDNGEYARQTCWQTDNNRINHTSENFRWSK